MTYFDNERHFSRWLVAEARERGWLAAQVETFQVVRRGKQTVAIPSKAATGLPDCFFAHAERGSFWAELKMPRGATTTRARELRPEQIEWIRAMRSGGVVVYVWGPHEQDEILAVLDGKASTSRLFVEASA